MKAKSGFARQEEKKQKALTGSLIRKLTNVPEHSRNFNTAMDFSIAYFQHHTFLSPDPSKIKRILQGVSEKMHLHSQTEKGEALDELLLKYCGAADKKHYEKREAMYSALHILHLLSSDVLAGDWTAADMRQREKERADEQEKKRLEKQRKERGEEEEEEGEDDEYDWSYERKRRGSDESSLSEWSQEDEEGEGDDKVVEKTTEKTAEITEQNDEEQEQEEEIDHQHHQLALWTRGNAVEERRRTVPPPPQTLAPLTHKVFPKLLQSGERCDTWNLAQAAATMGLTRDVPILPLNVADERVVVREVLQMLAGIPGGLFALDGQGMDARFVPRERFCVSHLSSKCLAGIVDDMCQHGSLVVQLHDICASLHEMTVVEEGMQSGLLLLLSPYLRLIQTLLHTHTHNGGGITLIAVLTTLRQRFALLSLLRDAADALTRHDLPPAERSAYILNFLYDRVFSHCGSSSASLYLRLFTDSLTPYLSLLENCLLRGNGAAGNDDMGGESSSRHASINRNLDPRNELFFEISAAMEGGVKMRGEKTIPSFLKRETEGLVTALDVLWTSSFKSARDSSSFKKLPSVSFADRIFRLLEKEKLSKAKQQTTTTTAISKKSIENEKKREKEKENNNNDNMNNNEDDEGMQDMFKWVRSDPQATRVMAVATGGGGGQQSQIDHPCSFRPRRGFSRLGPGIAHVSGRDSSGLSLQFNSSISLLNDEKEKTNDGRMDKNKKDDDEEDDEARLLQIQRENDGIELFSVIVEEEIAGAFRNYCSFLHRALVQELVQMHHLVPYLRAIRGVFLLESPQMHPFLLQLFSIIDQGNLTVHTINLHAMFVPFVNDMALSHGMNVSVAAYEAQQGESAQSLGLVPLQFLLNVPTPVTSVISAAHLKTYNQISRFLLSIQRAKHALDSCPPSRKLHLLKGPAAAAMSRCIPLRAEMLHILNNLQNYAMTRVVEGGWHEIEEKMSSSSSIPAARDAHDVHVRTLRDRCMLNPRAAPILNALQHILKLAMMFRDTYRSLQTWGDEIQRMTEAVSSASSTAATDHSTVSSRSRLTGKSEQKKKTKKMKKGELIRTEGLRMGLTEEEIEAEIVAAGVDEEEEEEEEFQDDDEQNIDEFLAREHKLQAGEIAQMDQEFKLKIDKIERELRDTMKLITLVLHKITKVGYHPHLTDLAVRLDFNAFYSSKMKV